MAVVIDSKDEITELNIRSKDPFNRTETVINPFLITDTINVPFCKGIELGGKIKVHGKVGVKFIGSLLERQVDDMVIAKKRMMEKNSVFLSLYCGYGKTICSLYLGCLVGRRILIIEDRALIKRGWGTAIEKFTNCKPFFIKSNTPIPNEALICVVGIDTMRNMAAKDINLFGTVIVDEAIGYCTQIRVENLLKLTPEYLIGLSADLDRVDGMDKALDYFFGDRKNFLRKISTKKFTVHKFNTTFKPVVRQLWGGKIDWNTVLDSICYNEERNKMIAEMAILHPNKKILILCKRKEQCQTIYKILVDRGVSTELLIGSTKSYKNCDVLVSTYSKAGKGFDDENCCVGYDGNRLNLLILASDITNPEQYIGRVFRCNNPVAYYLVDDFASFKKHWTNDLLPWFISRNGDIVEEWL